MRSFVELFGAAATVRASAPGRVNLIGEHTDYNDGLVLPAVIPLRTSVELAPRRDRRVRAWSAAYPDAVREFGLDAISAAHDWTDYVRGICRALEPGHGFDVRIESDVPLGSGLSSSASLLVAVARAVRTACALPLDDLQIALAARRAETEFVGAPVGVMDQMAASLGEDGIALFIDTRTLAWSRVPLPAGAAVAVVDSGLRHSHVAGEYRVRREECRRAAEALGVSSLREITQADVDRVARLPAPLDRRVRHVVSENARVLEVVDAFRVGDLRRAGARFCESHASMRDDFEVSLPAIDALVETAIGVPGVHGARLTGGGFGGAIVVLTDAGDVARVADAVLERCRIPAARLLAVVSGR
jgi:galactokinase